MTEAPHTSSKVLVYKSRLLPYSETFIREQVRMLSNWRGVLVGERLVRHGLSLDGIDVRLVGPRSRFMQRVVSLASVFLDLALPSSVRALRAEAADLLHVHFGVEAFAIWPLAKRLQLPVLITLHGYDINTYKEWWESGREGRKMRRYPTRLLRIATDPRVHFVAVSMAIKKRAIEFGIPSAKITVSPIGVDTQLFVPGPKPISARREILFVGRLVEKKGCRYLIEAFGQIQDRFPEYRLVIVGDGPLEAELQTLVRDQDIRVDFPGAMTSVQVRERMGETRVFCLPSITASNGDAEGLGIVILEAQACGVPVITSARGGAQEAIIDGESGIAHDEKDVAAIRDGLIALLQSDELAERYGRRGRQHVVENMNLSTCMLRLEDIYDQHAFGHNVPACSPTIKVAATSR